MNLRSELMGYTEGKFTKAGSYILLQVSKLQDHTSIFDLSSITTSMTTRTF